jgi:hypothetical protein
MAVVGFGDLLPGTAAATRHPRLVSLGAGMMQSLLLLDPCTFGNLFVERESCKADMLRSREDYFNIYFKLSLPGRNNTIEMQVERKEKDIGLHYHTIE